MVEAGQSQQEHDINIIEEFYLEEQEIERTMRSTESKISEVEAEEWHDILPSKGIIEGYFSLTQQVADMLQKHNITSKASFMALQMELIDRFSSAENKTTWKDYKT